MPFLHLDFETFSTVPFGKGGTSVNADVYMRHPTTEVLFQQWAVDDGEVRVEDGPEVHPDLEALLRDSRYTIAAFNAPFEWGVVEHQFGIDLPVSRYLCTMRLAYYHSHTGGLDDVCRQLHFADDLAKLKDGKKLVQKFCQPRTRTSKADDSTRWGPHNAPDDWNRFRNEYAPQDVVASRAILDYFTARYGLFEPEQQLWEVDQDINRAGWPLDAATINGAVQLYDALKGQFLSELADFTGLANPNSLHQMHPWLQNHGVYMPSLDKAHVADALARPLLPAPARKALTLWASKSRTTPDKFKALKRCNVGDRVRGTLQHGGASRTNRWSGRVFQPQNLYSARGWKSDQLDELCDDLAHATLDEFTVKYDDPLEALSAGIRPSVKASEGNTLVVVDLSSIESRVLGWMADCEAINDCFAEGRDTYTDFATRVFRVPYADVTKDMRTFCKPPVLGCGYFLSAKGLIAYAEGYGVHLDMAQAQRLVALWREAHPEVVNLWEAYRDMVTWVIRNEVSTGERGKVRFRRDDAYLMVDLPSGRTIYYREPHMFQDPKWGLQPAYWGRDDSAGNNGWFRQRTHGGKWVENFDQAIARDILARGMFKVHKWLRENNVPARIVGHIHDELVLEVAKEHAAMVYEFVVRTLSSAVPWAPGLLLDAEGGITLRYKKL